MYAEELTSFQAEETGCLTDNKVIVNEGRSVLNEGSKIVFHGKYNILYVEDGVNLSRSRIQFKGSNSVIYLRRSQYKYTINIDIYNDSAVYIGENCFYNGLFRMTASEHQNIVIGRDGLFSFGIYLRTSDPHWIYDNVSRQRINPSASVFIGDHVWIGQDVLILKGTKIGSGAIIGGGACVAGKEIASNAVAVGNPQRIVRENVFFLRDSVHLYTDTDTEKRMPADTNDYIYAVSEHTLNMNELDHALKEASSAGERLETIMELLVINDAKDRFAIAPRAKKSGIARLLERIKRK